MLAPWIFILLCPFSQAANTDGISEENKAKYYSPRIVILGMTGVGKSALGCSLLGMKQAECKVSHILLINRYQKTFKHRVFSPKGGKDVSM